MKIHTVGFYLARVPSLVSWPVGDLLEDVAGGPVDLRELRREFTSVCRSSQRSKRAGS